MLNCINKFTNPFLNRNMTQINHRFITKPFMMQLRRQSNVKTNVKYDVSNIDKLLVELKDVRVKLDEIKPNDNYAEEIKKTKGTIEQMACYMAMIVSIPSLCFCNIIISYYVIVFLDSI